MESLRVLLGTLLGIFLVMLPVSAPEAEPLQEQRPVCFELTLVEVPVSALKKAGIDVPELTKVPPPKAGSPPRRDLPAGVRGSKSYVDSDKLPAVVQSLLREKVGRVLARTRVETISGHKVSLQLGDQIDLDGTPEALDDNAIKLEYHLKYSEPLPQTEIEKEHGIPAGKRQFFSSLGIKLDAGKTTAHTGGPVNRTNSAGEVEEVAIVTLLRADFKPASDVREAAKQTAPPMPQGR